MKRWTGFLFFFLVAFALSLPLCAENTKDDQAKKPSWKISGQLEEACKCDAACPCWFGSKPTHMNCGGQLVYFITNGNYGDLKLDGLAFARASQSPDGKSMMESLGNWDFDYLYIDERANEAQRKAIEDINWQVMGKVSPKTEVRYVPITRKVEGKEHQIFLGNVGTFFAHLLDGGAGGAPRIANAPFSDPIRAEFEQGITTKFVYTDAGQNWNSQNSNYMFTEFHVDSEQYAKFNEMMMKKMQQMNPQEGQQKTNKK
jgi:hypothetical protein